MDAKKNLALYLLTWFGLAAAGEAQTYILPPAADISLSETAPNENSGSATVLSLSGGRALLRVDQTTIASAIGSGRLVSARLELLPKGLWEQGGPPAEAHRLTADWTEAGATWNCAIDTDPTNKKPDCATQWNGGTFAAEPSDTVESPGPRDWARFDVFPGESGLARRSRREHRHARAGAGSRRLSAGHRGRARRQSPDRRCGPAARHGPGQDPPPEARRQPDDGGGQQ